MKLFFTSLAVALAATTASSAAPLTPAPTVAPNPAPDAVTLAPFEAHSPATVGTRATPALNLARQLVAIMISSDQYMNLMRAGALVGAEQQGNVEEADVKQGIDAFVASIEPAMVEQLPNLREAYAQAYAREFTAAELQDMLAFAATPAGRHYLSRSRVLEADPQVLNMQGTMVGVMMEAVDRERKAVCAKHTAARIAAGDTKAKCPLADPTPQAG